MLYHKRIGAIALSCIVFALLICAGLYLLKDNDAFKLVASPAYASTLFSDDKVHTIDLVVDDWDSFIENATDEEYVVADVVIDGDVVSNVGLRAKGNTSLTSVSNMGSERYSFKIEFDHYVDGKTSDGLDKLSLNNLIFDATMMKDYVCYQLMERFGVNGPLSSFAYLRVNGEDFGLYVAVEGVEESWLERTHAGLGELYKPESQSQRRDEDVQENNLFAEQEEQMSEMQGLPDSDGGGQAQSQIGNGEPKNADNLGQEEGGFQLERGNRGANDGGERGGPGGMNDSSSATKLAYIDDDPASYADIFDTAKTSINEQDEQRLIASIKQLSEYQDVSHVVDIDQVLRYMVVHNFVVNDDSYTGNIVHNYYLYEYGGKMAMVPWDYNLAFGAFMSSSAQSAINDPIDEVLSDRPMQAWIFSDPQYTARYHELYQEFIDTCNVEELVSNAAALIEPYVEMDPTQFYSVDEFRSAVDMLKQFLALRIESVEGQLAGIIPATEAGQEADPSALIASDGISIDTMGSMTGMQGGGGMAGPGGAGAPGGAGGPGGGGVGPGGPSGGVGDSADDFAGALGGGVDNPDGGAAKPSVNNAASGFAPSTTGDSNP